MNQKAAMDKKRVCMLEAPDRFRQDIVHFGAKEVDLISSLA